MILKSKFNFYQIYKIIFLFFLINISNLYAHNFVNGGYKVHCENKVKFKNNHNKFFAVIKIGNIILYEGDWLCNNEIKKSFWL